MNPQAASTERTSAFRSGFELHPIAARAAAATTRQWRDALVVSALADGTIAVVDILDGRTTRLWNYLDYSATLREGDPVAIHDRYGVLAVGNLRLSVAVV